MSWVDDATGVFLISITSAQTSALVKGIGKYNIEVTDGTTRDRLLQGRVYVDGDVA